MPIGTINQRIAGLGTHHIAVQTQDYEASIAFYTDVMGMAPDRRIQRRRPPHLPAGYRRWQPPRTL